ncbi:hypothetical protein BOO86_21745 [Mycobacterium sp. CBMA 234]|uniref:MlaD family protein n=1 Tax=Mycolicibacterium sp. CBMA 234 TaxID=1918495 RepID=UPI0012DBE640|nr:MlaD family protein [Mycolicibacterium sp. CBMA 234]MUL67112.1 hypothetical protein [Mycolicibacterium sp. CBMA 234]
MKWPSAALAVAVVATALSGCGINPVKMSSPDIGGPPSFRATIEFSSALNLPAGAKITYQGTGVGIVRAVTLDHGVVDVKVDIDKQVRIPDSATAAIVQDTVLGDSYVALTKSATADSAALLTDGARIPVGQTRPPTSIEDMLTTVATLLGSGSIQRLQNAFHNVNAALPKSDDDARKIATTVAQDLRALARNSTDLDGTISNLSRVSRSLNDQKDTFDALLTDSSVAFWTKYFGTVAKVTKILASVGGLANDGYWVVPVLDSVSTALEQTGVGSGGAVDQFTDQTLLPFLTDPRIQITDVVTPEGTNRMSDARRVLAQLGALG